MREDGWLQDVFKAASKRVEEWPEWKKASEARISNSESNEPASSQAKEQEASHAR
jgi:hypothetical protein